ncbi:MAG: serine/threonine protein phosphatase [Lachnospiraceae bacterium]|nr:serine/threonine protein phosphatase [Lachnospiraceae bacterium]
MSYTKRLDRAFENAPILPITSNTKYVFFSDCHRGSGNNNDNFLKNVNNYFAALQYYFQYGFSYIEVGDGDELWENCKLNQITEIHSDIFLQLSKFQKSGRLYMLYGNHDIEKKSIKKDHGNLFPCLTVYEGLIFKPDNSTVNLHVTHGHQADFLNSVLWRLAKFLVRHLWTPLENLGFSDPTSAAKNNTKKEKIEKRFIEYAKKSGCLLLAGHTHRPMLGNSTSPYYNCGSCVHPRCITCIELTGYNIRLVKWCSCTEKSGHFGNIYTNHPPIYPVYIKREVLTSDTLTSL